MSMKQILIHSLPNLQCLILEHTKLPSKESELTSFLARKLQRIESKECLRQKISVEENDFSYFVNLQHIKLKYSLEYQDERLKSESRKINNSLTKLPKLETLSIYIINPNECIVYSPESVLNSIMHELDENQIKTLYEIKYWWDYSCVWFIRKTVSGSI
jgi:hypothetical protein